MRRMTARKMTALLYGGLQGGLNVIFVKRMTAFLFTEVSDGEIESINKDRCHQWCCYRNIDNMTFLWLSPVVWLSPFLFL